MSLKYYLIENNSVYNVPEIKPQLERFASGIKEQHRKAFINAIFSEIIKNVEYHQTLKELPPNSPAWAKSAFDRKELVTASISPELRDKIERISHWIQDLETRAGQPTSDPATSEDRKDALRLLGGLPKMNFQGMLDQEQSWWKRSSDTDVSGFEGMEEKMSLGSGWGWWQLLTEDAFKREGKALQNCLGSFHTAASSRSNGQTILVLKDPRGQSHVVMRIKGTSVVEVKGLNNRPPAAAYMGKTNEAIQALGYSFDTGGQSDLQNSGYGWTPEDGLFHISEKYAFEPGPKVGNGLVLVKWTAPRQYWKNSFQGNSQVGGGSGSNPERFDLVSPRNTIHPIITMLVSKSNDGTDQVSAIGYLPNPARVIKETGMRILADQIESAAAALDAGLSMALNGSETRHSFDPGLRLYGLTVTTDGGLSQDIETAREMSVKVTPKSILTITSPSERLQIAAVSREPVLVLELADPPVPVQITAIKNTPAPHSLFNRLLEKLDGKVADQVLLQAVARDWHCLELAQRPSEEAERLAISASAGYAMAYIAHWRARNDRGLPPIDMQLQAVSSAGGVEAMRGLIDGSRAAGWKLDPKVQMAAATSKELDVVDLEELLELLSSSGQLDPNAKQTIERRVAEET
jgi:hypothetical protein